MDGQKVAVDKPFVLNGKIQIYHPMMPRDTDLGPEESINCHCFVQPVADEEILGYSLEERQKMQAAAIAEDDGKWEKELDEKAHREADEWKEQFPLNNEKLFMARKIGEDDFAQTRALTDEEEARYFGILNNRYENGTLIAKKVYNKYIPENGGVYNDCYDGKPHFANRSNPKYSGIRMSYLDDLENPQGAGTTLFHEQGHFIDSKAGRPSNSKSFRNALINDVKAYEDFIKESKNLSTTNEVRDFIADELLQNDAKTAGVQDIWRSIRKKI